MHMGHKDLFRASLVNFRCERHDGSSLCAVLGDSDDPSATRLVFESTARYFDGLGSTRAWPLISKFVVPALRALARQDLLDVELLAPRDKARSATLGVTVLESLSGICRFQPSDFRLSAVHSGLDARGGEATAAEPWLHWASQAMVRAQLNERLRTLNEGALELAKATSTAGAAIEFTLVAPVVSIEPNDIPNGPIEIEIELAVTATSEHWDQCALVCYDAGLRSWRLARYAQLDDTAQLGGVAREERPSVERREGVVVGRVEAKHASCWSAVTWCPQPMQIEARAFLYSTSSEDWVTFLFGLRGDGDLSSTCNELLENKAVVALTIMGSKHAELLALSARDRIEVVLVGAQGETSGADEWRHRRVPRVDLKLAGRLVQPLEVTFTSAAHEGRPLPLERPPGLPLFSAPAQAAASLPPNQPRVDAATTQLYAPCSPNDGPLHDVAHEAYRTAALMPNWRVLYQGNGGVRAATLWVELAQRPPVDVLVISAHCAPSFPPDGQNVELPHLVLVDEGGRRQALPAEQLIHGLAAHGASLRLLFLNACKSDELAACVITQNLVGAMSWSTAVESRAAHTFSYLFFRALYSAPDGAPRALPLDPAQLRGAISTAFARAAYELQGDPLTLQNDLPRGRYGGMPAAWLIGDPAASVDRLTAQIAGRPLAGIPVCELRVAGEAVTSTIKGIPRRS